MPWCCYVLVHKSTVPASSLTIQDLPRFYNIDGEPGYCKVPNEWLLGSHYKRSMNDRDFLVLKKEIASALRCVKAVVPTTIVKDCLARSEAELERKVDELKDSGLTATTVKLLIKHHVVEMDKFILHRELPVDKEIQKNSWCIKYLKTALESCGLTVEANYTCSEHSVFGKSSPDFLCVHGDFGKVVQGVFTLDEDDSMDDDGSMDDDDIDDDKAHDDGKSSYNVVGASSSTSAVDAPVQLLGSTTEFKMDAVTERAWAQMFANMARIASILAVNSLEFGYLVSSIWIYGLLTSYDTEKCTPMLYEVNFDDNEAHFYVGKSMNFSDCLALVSLKIRDSCSTYTILDILIYVT